jgi:hypothetical protein
MVRLALGNLEGEVAVKTMRSERGQSILLFAILLPLMSLFLLGILDFMATNARVMETVAAADLAAHAGAQEIAVLPDGTITATRGGNVIAARYFDAQRPSYAQLVFVSCGRHQGRPACLLEAQARSAGILLPARWIKVRAVGYLAHGVTRGDQ